MTTNVMDVKIDPTDIDRLDFRRVRSTAVVHGRHRLVNGSIRVLCAQSDVIGKIGGGEAATARMLERVTDAFVTWPVSRQPTMALAENFEYVTIDASFREAIREQLRSLPILLRSKDCDDFLEAVCIAHAARGREFDVVECPDYVTYGRFLPFAFAEYDVKYKRLVCALHGRLSRTLEIENKFRDVLSPAELDRLRQWERQFIFGAADIRYGFSERYVAQTRALHSLPIELVDPLCALPEVCPGPFKESEAGAENHLWFVARQDRSKGADLFLAAVFRAGPEIWENYAMCGPSVRHGGSHSAFEGMSYCRNRGIPYQYRGPMPYSEIVRQVYRSGGVVVVPSREETFSLVALEALLNGTPVLISENAGAADFIRKRFGAGFAGAQEFDPFNEFDSASAMRTMWREREERGRALRNALDSIDWTPQPEMLTHAYDSAPRFDAALRDEAFRSWDRILKNLFLRQPSLEADPDTMRQSDSWTFLDPKSSGGNAIAETPVEGMSLFRLADKLLEAPPSANLMVATHQARRLSALSPHTNRARIYLYLAKCEDAVRLAVAAAYRLRAFRMGALTADEIPALERQLDGLGLSEEETCLRLWKNQDSESDKQITGYLEERRKRLLNVTLVPPEYILDRRDAGTPRVSIIVSIYNATKTMLDHFLAHLGAVAMVKNRQAEVVFIDSGSPVHQKELLDANPGLRNISYVLARSIERETIQTAWNRGLQLSRGEYITCLGVDEGITETALDDLAEFLDTHPETDWVTANTVITQVDAEGHWKHDVLTYTRATYTRFDYFNDCTYINYVGGLYRRSIHHRFGWYDGTFKGAGDTEFKCRIFPFIHTAALPKTLGFYFDFPSDRVTNSANIEVEDLRAWYVFRTIGGIEYLMGGKDADDWEELFWTALSGRRCWSTMPADCDLSLAANVLTGVLKRHPSHHLREFEAGLRALVREMRLLQNWSGRRPWLGAIAELDLIERSHRFFQRCASARPDLNFPPDFRADALFFAHSWTW